jgi:hypothetical protein
LEQTLDAIITKYAISDSQLTYANCKETKEIIISLFSLLPKIYQQRGEKTRGEALKSLLPVLGEQFGILYKDIERLYKEWFISTLDSWEVPYIGGGNVDEARAR